MPWVARNPSSRVWYLHLFQRRVFSFLTVALHPTPNSRAQPIHATIWRQALPSQR
jgi:hypothetical protein